MLAVCGALVYFGYPEISKLINGEQTVTSSEADTASDISSADNSSEAQTSNVSAEGGNPDNTDSFALEITISEDKYFVNNHEIGIEELKSEIDGLEAGATIKINDEKSSLKRSMPSRTILTKRRLHTASATDKEKTPDLCSA